MQRASCLVVTFYNGLTSAVCSGQILYPSPALCVRGKFCTAELIDNPSNVPVFWASSAPSCEIVSSCSVPLFCTIYIPSCQIFISCDAVVWGKFCSIMLDCQLLQCSVFLARYHVGLSIPAVFQCLGQVLLHHVGLSTPAVFHSALGKFFSIMLDCQFLHCSNALGKFRSIMSDCQLLLCSSV